MGLAYEKCKVSNNSETEHCNSDFLYREQVIFEKV